MNELELRLNIWRHVKTAATYRVLREGLLEADKTPVVVYQSISSGEVWVRPKSEFLDGRFEPFNTIHQAFGAWPGDETDEETEELLRKIK